MLFKVCRVWLLSNNHVLFFLYRSRIIGLNSFTSAIRGWNVYVSLWRRVSMDPCHTTTSSTFDESELLSCLRALEEKKVSRFYHTKKKIFMSVMIKKMSLSEIQRHFSLMKSSWMQPSCTGLIWLHRCLQLQPPTFIQPQPTESPLQHDPPPAASAACQEKTKRHHSFCFQRHPPPPTQNC